MRTVICPNCKADNLTDSLICEECGLPLPEREARDNQRAEREPPIGETEQLLDWLKDLEPAEEKPAESVSKPAPLVDQEKGEDSLTGWVSELSPETNERDDVGADDAPAEWFDSSDESDERKEKQTSQLSHTTPLSESPEIEGVPEQIAGTTLPDWLVQESPSGESIGDEPESFPDIFSDIHQPTETKDIGDWSQDSFPSQIEEEKLIQGESLSDGESFFSDSGESEDWYDESTSSEIESAFDDMLDDFDDTSEKAVSEEWVDLIDEIPEPASDSMGVEPVLERAPELSEPEIPDWLHSLKPEELADQLGVDQPAESTGPLSGLKGVIPVAAVISEPTGLERAPEYSITKKQQQQVALLKQLTQVVRVDEAPELDSSYGDKSFGFRLVIGFLLLLIVIVGWLVPSINQYLPNWVSPPVSEFTLNAYSELDTVSNQPVLVAFEYTPAFAGELEPIANSLLQRLSENGSNVITISQVAAGVPVANHTVGQFDELRAQELGFLPGDAIGLRSFAGCLNNGDECSVVGDMSVDEETLSLLGDVGLIIILSGERDAIVNWIEQVGSQVDIPLIAGVTQAMGPLVAPYLASNQLAGAVEGLPAAAAMENGTAGQESLILKAMNSLTLAQWLVIIVLILGALFYGLTETMTSITEKQE